MSNHFEILHKASQASGNFPSPPSQAEAATQPLRPQIPLPAQDEVTKLIQRLFILPGEGKAPATVAFCGVSGGDGCTWVCTHAAEFLASQLAGKVCLVDANLRSPSLHRLFEASNLFGFSDFAKSTRPVAEFAQRIPGVNLWLMPSGPVGREPNGALNPARLRARLAELRAEFDQVLIDTPPLSLFNDGILIGQAVEGVVLVIGSDSTRRESARIVKRSLDAATVPVFGAVFNRRTFPIPEKLYRKL
ncbi:MAG TPA: CpsD/CapB family tyrosine-protein kinase [Candidatus Acidoferrum sp.]|nr:CpsD/CapB family tyrosine-protein kinase [Candidatus Acidoferrum sp.]